MDVISPPSDRTARLPEIRETLVTVLRQRAVETPDKPFLLLGNRAYTWFDVYRAAVRFAAHLRQRRLIDNGDRVAIVLAPPNIPHFVITWFGTMLAGGIPVPANIKDWDVPVLQHVLRDSGARLVVTAGCTIPFKDRRRALGLRDVREAVCDEETSVQGVVTVPLWDLLSPTQSKWWLLQALRAAAVRDCRSLRAAGTLVLSWSEVVASRPPNVASNPSLDDIAAILYTSGSTGPPKGVVLTHRNLVANALQCALRIEPLLRDPASAIISAALPFYHSYGITTALVYGAVRGIPIALIPNPVERGAILNALRRHHVTVFLGVPKLFERLIEDAGGSPTPVTPALEMAISGSAPLSEGIEREFAHRFGIPITEGYGLTETSPVVAIGVPNVKGIGWPMAETRVAFRGSQPSPHGGIVGELLVKGPQVMSGYWHVPSAEQPFLPSNWLATGDWVHQLPDGRLFIVDRVDDILKLANGEKVPLAEVDRLLCNHPDIEQAFAFSVHTNGAVEIGAAVLLKNGHTVALQDVEDIQRWWRAQSLHPYREPRHLLIIAANEAHRFFPLSGKPQRRLASRQYAAMQECRIRSE